MVNDPQTEAASVLVVDDDAGVRETIAFLLARHFRVATAASGEEALETLRHRRFDLVTLDFKMRGMSGIETLERLRAIDGEVPVVMISALDTPVAMERAERLGAFRWVSKPFDGKELVRVMDEASRARRDRRV